MALHDAVGDPSKSISAQEMQFAQWWAHQQFLLLKDNQKWKKYCQSRNIDYSQFGESKHDKRDEEGAPNIKHAAVQVELSQTALKVPVAPKRNKMNEGSFQKWAPKAAEIVHTRNENDQMEELRTALRDMQMEVKQLKLTTHADMDPRRPRNSKPSKASLYSNDSDSLRSQLISSITQYNKRTEPNRPQNVQFQLRHDSQDKRKQRPSVLPGGSKQILQRKPTLTKPKTAKGKGPVMQKQPVSRILPQKQILPKQETSEQNTAGFMDAQKISYIKSIEKMIKRLDEIQESQQPIWNKWEGYLDVQGETKASDSLERPVNKKIPEHDKNKRLTTVILTNPVMPVSALPIIEGKGDEPKETCSIPDKVRLTKSPRLGIDEEGKGDTQINVDCYEATFSNSSPQPTETENVIVRSCAKEIADEVYDQCIKELAKDIQGVIDSIVMDCYDSEFVP